MGMVQMWCGSLFRRQAARIEKLRRLLLTSMYGIDNLVIMPMVCTQQEELVIQLQEQHYEQYMQHVQSQMELHQRQQIAQLHSLRRRQQQHQPAVAVEISPDNQQVEFHTEADVAMETYRRHDDAGMVTGGEVNGASDAALLLSSSSSAGDQHHLNSHDDNDEQDDFADDESDTEDKGDAGCCCCLCVVS